MTKKNPTKTRARELQAVTGWPYLRCRTLVESHPSKDVTDIANLARIADDEARRLLIAQLDAADAPEDKP